MDKVILTQEGYEKLSEELNFLKTKKRREVADQLEKARAHGDLRENSEYDAAKEAKAHLETKIAQLELKLSNAKIIDPSEMPDDKAYIGTTVEVKNLNTGDTMKFTLVPPDETDFDAGKIGTTSPIGQGLLGKAVKDVAEINVPAGIVKYEILKITRE